MSAPFLLDADFVVERRDFDVAAHLGLEAGERLSLFGQSGAGKTTCLEAIAGCAPLKQGAVRLDGRLVNVASRRRPGRVAEGPAEPRDRGVALVRQPTTLFPHLSVAANVTYGMKRSEVSGTARTVHELLDLVGLAGLARALPDALSGGQRQRVCLARVLARRFRALLLDEPLSAVDVPSRAALREAVVEATSRQGAVAVLVTHDLSEAQVFGHRLGIVDGGRLLQLGSPEAVVREPATVRVAELFGYHDFVPAGGDKLWALHPDRYLEGAHAQSGVVLSGSVRSVHAFGPRFACALAVGSPGDGPTVRVHVQTPPVVGEHWSVTALDPPLVSRQSEHDDTGS